MLKYELTTLEGLEESFKPLYVEHDGKYRLKVKGIDPADELKKALQKEREEAKGAKNKLSELERERQEAEEKRLAEKQEFEKLWQAEKEAKSKTAAELEALRKSISEKERREAALQVAMSLTKDAKRAELLTKEAMALIHHTPDGITYADGMDSEKLKMKLKADYPFLVDGNQASGGGTTGGAGAGATRTITRAVFDGMDAISKAKFLKERGQITQ